MLVVEWRSYGSPAQSESVKAVSIGEPDLKRIPSDNVPVDSEEYVLQQQNEWQWVYAYTGRLD
jgi:hypothetical protein